MGLLESKPALQEFVIYDEYGEFKPHDDPVTLKAFLDEKHRSAVEDLHASLSLKGKGGYDPSYYLGVLIKRKLYKSKDTAKFYEYFLHYLMYLFPKMNFHEWRQDMIFHWCKCWCEGIQEYATHGASNCQKTSTMAMVTVGMWLMWHKMTSVYVTSPKKQATQSGVWANMTEYFEGAMAMHEWVKKEVDSKHTPSGNIIYVKDRRFPRGFMQIITSDQATDMVGRKPKDTEDGAMIFLYDEAPEFKGRVRNGILELFTNLKSVDNARIWLSGNFSRKDDLLGVVSTPKMKGGYRALRVDTHFGWLTKRNGLVRRYDGHYSPNVIAGYNRWSGLNTVEKLAQILADSFDDERSPMYMRFARSFPVLDEDLWTILNDAIVAKANAYRQPIWAPGKIERYGFCDPGWGGDPCKVIGVEKGKVYDAGSYVDHIHVFTPPTSVPMTVPDLEEDDTDNIVTVNEQIVGFCLKFCRDNRIPIDNFGYDGSMRASIVQAFDKGCENLPGRFLAIDNLGKASDKDSERISSGWQKKGYRQDGIVKRASEMFANYNTEQHFDIQYLVLHKQITSASLDFVDAAFEQLCNRQWDFAGGKRKKVQTKKEYKEDNNNQSPTEADILVGAVQMAIRKDFKLGAIEAAKGVLTRNAALVLAARMASEGKKKRALGRNKSLDTRKFGGKINRKVT